MYLKTEACITAQEHTTNSQPIPEDAKVAKSLQPRSSGPSTLQLVELFSEKVNRWWKEGIAAMITAAPVRNWPNTEAVPPACSPQENRIALIRGTDVSRPLGRPVALRLSSLGNHQGNEAGEVKKGKQNRDPFLDVGQWPIQLRVVALTDSQPLSSIVWLGRQTLLKGTYNLVLCWALSEQVWLRPAAEPHSVVGCKVPSATSTARRR